MSGNTELPPGMDPNDDVSHLVYIPSAVFVVLCPVLVAMRMWARLRRGGKTGVDDWICIAALVRPHLLLTSENKTLTRSY